MNKTQIYSDILRDAKHLCPVCETYKHHKGGIYMVVGHFINSEDKQAHARLVRIDGPDFNPCEESEIEFGRPITELLNKLQFIRVRKVQREEWVSRDA